MAATQKDTMEAAQVLNRAGIPILFWGDPGTGKTETVERFAEAAGWHIETVLASLYDPTDFGGLPVLDGDGVMFAPSIWAKTVAAQEKHSLVFFDEINTATPSTQNSLLRVVLNRVVGDCYLGDNVSFMAAANPGDQNAGAWSLSAPLANRFAHLDWPLNFDEYRMGAMRGWPTITPLVDAEPQKNRISFYTSMQMAFHDRRPGHLIMVPEEETQASRGWPSPRTWSRLAECLAIADAVGIPQQHLVRSLIANALVGPIAAPQFLSFLETVDLPDPEELLADPSSFQVPERDDQRIAVMEALAGAVLSNMTDDRWYAAMEVCIVAAKQGIPDIAAVAVRTLSDIDNRPVTIDPPEGIEIFVDLLVHGNPREKKDQ